MFYALGFIFVSGMMTNDYFESVVEKYEELAREGPGRSSIVVGHVDEDNSFDL